MLLIHMAARRERCVVGASAWAWTFTSADGGGGERKGSTLGKRSSSQSSAPRWCSQPRHCAAHGEQPRNSSKVDKLPLDLGEALPSAPDAKCQHHRLLFLSLGKQTGAVGKNGPCKSKLSWLAREWSPGKAAEERRPRRHISLFSTWITESFQCVPA